MGTRLDSINEQLATWIGEQRMFFVSTAPMAADGHVNCSPKGGECFRILGPHEAVYQDYTGSGAETAAHVRENGRIVIMFCAFTGDPRIVRLHGRGTVIAIGTPGFAEMAERFPAHAGTRAFIRIAVNRIGSSCGFSVPRYEHQGPRDILDKWTDRKGAEGLATYRQNKNRRSIDGLPAFD